jgi:hypothetical protein
MIRRTLAVLLAAGFLLATWALAQEAQPPDKDEPPLRLKKKPRADEEKPEPPKKPAAEEKKPDEPGKEPEPTEPEENEKEVLDRVAKNMRSLEERLANKELGDGTRQVGDDILKDLESLIRSMENPPSAGGGSEDSQNNPSGQSNDQKNRTGKKGSSGQSSPSGGTGKRGDRSKSGGTQQQPGNSGQQPGGQAKRGSSNPMGGGQQEKNAGNDPSGTSNKNRKTGPNDKDGELNRDDDSTKGFWGNLPEATRAEMNAYSTDKEVIPKYDALIKKCSRTIAEQSSRKDK